jgi:hypothetical protein
MRSFAVRQGRPVVRIEGVSVYEDRRDELEKHEFMMGVPRGRLAVTLDVLTDALVLVGQHGVYCQSARQPGLRLGGASGGQRTWSSSS